MFNSYREAFEAVFPHLHYDISYEDKFKLLMCFLEENIDNPELNTVDDFACFLRKYSDYINCNSEEDPLENFDLNEY